MSFENDVSKEQELITLFDSRMDVFPENLFSAAFLTKDNIDEDLDE